jgi:hypothetical protein
MNDDSDLPVPMASLGVEAAVYGLIKTLSQ